MSGDVMIRAEGLGKKYIIGHQAERESYVALRDVIARNARNLWRTSADIIKGRPSIAGDEVEEFWALRDISFQVERGEVVGIIGRNGAGKSTLLKILSRITEPTEGRVEIRGRVASLLEVGTGFHPELTGRENIYLNGAILGMTHAEIRRKFDEIVAFAEVDRFLDTPVKRYSSGMYVRLAFAVAAHLEPEILIIDEVLAVGDAAFQKKCLGKMGEVAGEGRTVLFVSHNMAAVRNLCQAGLYLENGRANGIKKLEATISEYVASGLDQATSSASVATDECELSLSHLGNGVIRIGGRSPFATRPNFTVGVTLLTLAGVDVLETGSADHRASSKLSSNEFEFEFRIPQDHLRPGEYAVEAYSYLHDQDWLIRRNKGPRIRLEVPDPMIAGSIYYHRAPGYGPIIKWEDRANCPHHK
jgi:lipopolysaccharide transport system ATP-binding protein